MKKELFESKIKPILLWMGTIVASIMAIAYVVVVFVLIEGFKSETLLNTTLFSIITALVGFCIMQMLKVQGQSFAANLEENKKIRKEYSQTKTKDKKARSMKYYWITSGAKDIAVKCLTLALTSIGMIYIMIEGSGDYNLLFLAGVNLLMFAGFGLISLVKTYDFYNDSYVPYMLEKIEEANQNEDTKELGEKKKERKRKNSAKAKTEKLLDVVKEESNKQRDDCVHVDRGTDILESSMDNGTSCTDNRSVVLDSNNSNNSVLGRTVHTGNCVTNSTDSGVKETSQENKI